MNRLLVILFCLLSPSGFSQVPTSTIKPLPIDITCNKTTNIIFPYTIQHVDRGSQDVLAQKITGAVNVLELKAAKDSFAETNVSVVTADGKFYSLLVNYVKQPSALNVVIQKDIDSISMVMTPGNIRVLEERAAKILQSDGLIHGISDTHDRIRARLKGLYIQDDVFYFQLQFFNRSNISYGIDDIRFTILDKHKSRRTATQETPLQPVYTTGIQQSIGAGTKPVIIIALPKFTLPGGKYLSIHITERGGGRDLLFRVGNKVLVRASKVQ